MKTIKRLLLFIALLSGIVGLWLSLTASSIFKPCEFANTNILFIKEQTEEAISASELKMSRYYAYKALNGIWNAQYSFSECGCEDANLSIDLAYDNLKEATKSNNLEESKIFLKIALKNTRNSVLAIEAYKKQEHTYDENVLSINVTGDKTKADDNSNSEHTFSVEKIEASLNKFSKSIDNVVNINDCEKARKFIVTTRKKTQDGLINPDISQRKHYYHNRVLQITNDALKKLDGCSSKNLLAGK